MWMGHAAPALSELPALNKTSTPWETVSALAAALRQMRHYAMQGTENDIAEACAIACRMADELDARGIK
jgi:hypothetical protein